MATLFKTTPMGGGVGVTERMNGSASCDMWALKPDDSIVSPNFLFQHPVYSSQLPARGSPRSAGNTAKKRSKYHKIGPRTLNPRLVNPYSKVPIKIQAPGLENLPSSEQITPAQADSQLSLGQEVILAKRQNYPSDHQPNMYSEQPFSDHLYPENSGMYPDQPFLSTMYSEEEKIYPHSMYSHLFPDKHEASEPVLDSDILEDDMFEKEDYAMTSDNPDDEESVDENYKAITDEALGITSTAH